MLRKHAVSLFVIFIMLFSLSASAQLGGDEKSTFIKQGNQTYGDLGPATSVCDQIDPDDCDNQFQSGTSIHIGEKDYDNAADPYALFQIPIYDSQLVAENAWCVSERNLSLEFRYQPNDIFHGTGSDHDIYVKLYDFENEEWELLDSTVNEVSSSGTRQGTLYGSDEEGWIGVGTEFITESTRTFDKNYINATGEEGEYILIESDNVAWVFFAVQTNPGDYWGSDGTRIEIDWFRLNYSLEQLPPLNPENPTFVWDDESLWMDGNPTGPTTVGWYNSGSNIVNLNFGVGGFDQCGFQHLQYKWLPINSNSPLSSENGSILYPEDNANSVFSGVEIPNDSGEYNFWYKSVDILSNEAGWTSSGTFSFDYDIPNFDLEVVDNSWYNSSNPPILSWNAASDDDSGVWEYVIQKAGLRELGDVRHLTGENEYNFQIEDVNDLTQGSNLFEIYARDNSQPFSNEKSIEIEVFYDSESPEVNYPFGSGEKYNTNNPEISWGAPLAFDGLIGSGLSRCIIEVDGVQILEIDIDECSELNGIITLPYFADGVHEFVIIACDFTNNCNEDNYPRSFVIDTNEPTVSEISIGYQGVWSNANEGHQINAKFSDISNGFGSGIDKIYHGFYSENELPNSTQIKEDFPMPSFCSIDCEEYNLNTIHQDLGDGIWIWHFLALDQHGNEFQGFHELRVMVDSTDPVFTTNPELELINDIYTATFEAEDSTSGITGYFIKIGDCNFDLEEISEETSYSFSANIENPIVCIKAYDAAGNSVQKTFDSTDPTIFCEDIGNGIVLVSSPIRIDCSLSDPSGINLYKSEGRVVSVILDNEHLVPYLQSSHNGMNVSNWFYFDIPKMFQGIGEHEVEVTVEDKYGRTSVMWIEYQILGEGIIIDFDDVILPQNYSLIFNWDKTDLENFWRTEFMLSGVNMDTLDEISIRKYFNMQKYNHNDDNPLNDRYILTLKSIYQPNIGESISIEFNVNDGFNTNEYVIDIQVESCPNSYFHNLTDDSCSKIVNTEKSNFFFSSYSIIIIPIMLMIPLGIVLSRKFWWNND